HAHPPPPPSPLSLHDALPISAPASESGSITLICCKPAQHGAGPAKVTVTGTPPMVTIGVVEVSPVANSARYVGEFAVRVLKSPRDRKSTRLNSSHVSISYAVF